MENKDELKENVLIYDILYKTFTGAKPLSILVNETDAFIKIYDRIKYLVLFWII